MTIMTFFKFRSVVCVSVMRSGNGTRKLRCSVIPIGFTLGRQAGWQWAVHVSPLGFSVITVRKSGILLVRVFEVSNDESHGNKNKFETIERVDNEEFPKHVSNRFDWRSYRTRSRHSAKKDVQKFQN